MPHGFWSYLLRVVGRWLDNATSRRCGAHGCVNDGEILTWLRENDVEGPRVRLCVGCYRAWRGRKDN